MKKTLLMSAAIILAGVSISMANGTKPVIVVTAGVSAAGYTQAIANSAAVSACNDQLAKRIQSTCQHPSVVSGGSCGLAGTANGTPFGAAATGFVRVACN